MQLDAAVSSLSAVLPFGAPSLDVPRREMLGWTSSRPNRIATRPRRSVAAYWASRTAVPPIEAVRSAFLRAGIDPSALTPTEIDRLAGLDEFHCLGAAATTELADMLSLDRDARILDIGCGIGGPSRRLVSRYGCHVTGVDLTKEFLTIAEQVSNAMGLSRRLTFLHGDATALPVGTREFDFVWLQVATSNITNRLKLYREVRRVLRSEGRAGIFDILSGDGGPVHFPVPWAVDETTNALLSHAETLAVVAAAGMRVIEMRDVSAAAQHWFMDQAVSGSGNRAPLPLGFHVLLPDWTMMAWNQARNLRERRIHFVQMVLEPV